MPLPSSPMLSSPGEIPTGPGWAFEVKWDGFRALVSTESGLEVRSRRGWNMTPRLPELQSLRTGLVLDCELVAFNDAGGPDWPLLCRRVLHRDGAIPIHLMIFDLLAVDGECLLAQPYEERRAQLDALRLDGPAWRTPDTFDDGDALYAAVCERGLEGIVAKAARSSYRPGRRGWIKVKNPNYWRRHSEIAAMKEGDRRVRIA